MKSELEEVVTPLTKESTGARIDEYFATHPAWGKVISKTYKGFFIDFIGITFHAFEITTDTKNSATGMDWYGAIVTSDLVDVAQNKDSFKQILDASTPVQ